MKTFALKHMDEPSSPHQSAPTLEQTVEAARLLKDALRLLGVEAGDRTHFHGSHSQDRLLRLHEVENLTGLRKSAIYDLIQHGAFPRSTNIGIRAARWSEVAIQIWISSQVERHSNFSSTRRET